MISERDPPSAIRLDDPEESAALTERANTPPAAGFSTQSWFENVFSDHCPNVPKEAPTYLPFLGKSNEDLLPSLHCIS